MALLKSHARSASLRLHRWLGLALGPAFVLLGLSGSLLVFYVEIDAAIDPALRNAVAEPASGQPPTSWQPVVEALQRAHPQRDRCKSPPTTRLATSWTITPSGAGSWAGAR